MAPKEGPLSYSPKASVARERTAKSCSRALSAAETLAKMEDEVPAREPGILDHDK